VNNPHTKFTAFNVHNNTIAQLADTDQNDNQRTGTPNMTAQSANLPKEKQTNLGLYLTAKEAYEKWKVKSVAKADDTLLVMCRSGGRSAIAVNQLGQAGFKNVYNITDGMEGDVVDDPDSVFLGQRPKNGWKNSGAPWTYKLTPERMLLPKQQN
jgi:rhodanese-related sulfurtransferase